MKSNEKNFKKDLVVKERKSNFAAAFRVAKASSNKGCRDPDKYREKSIDKRILRVI